MPFYVDDMRARKDVPNGNRTVRARWSHLMADTHDELMAAARELGLKPEWIQDAGTRREHFDLVDAKRKQALEMGAVGITYPRGVADLVGRKQTTERMLALDEQAAQELREGNYDKALALLNEARGLNPEAMPERLTEHARQVVEARDQAKAFAGLDMGLAKSQQARQLDQQAGECFRRGDYSKALSLLGEVRVLDPGIYGLDEHMQRVRTAEREAVAKVSRPRDLGELAATFGERLGQQARYAAERDANRPEPTERCDVPKGDGQCGEPGHAYPAGRRCDEHRPKPLEIGEAGYTPPDAITSMATYQDAVIEYRDLSHGNPEHQCILPDHERGE
jgi:tetratricopeptide (TPR) repeat protein